MGDRTGLTRLDRTNGFDDGRDYMRVKQLKLAKQNDEIREALRHRNSVTRTDIFKGISINVNGRTQPTADELKRLILLNGGDYHPYYRYQKTKFMIATNLSIARIKNLRPDDRVILPEWITESIHAKCLLPYQDYQLSLEESRNELNYRPLVTEMISSSSNQDTTIKPRNNPDLQNRNFKKFNKKSQDKRIAPITRNHDIREMFLRCTQHKK